MATFTLRVITSQKVLFQKEAEFLLVRTIEGDLGIMPNHSPFVAELAIGEMKVRDTDRNEEYYYVSGGFLEVSNKNVVTVLADEAMWAKDIDVERAKHEAEVAQAKLTKLQEDREILLTQRALQEALTKVKLAEKHM